MAVIEGGVSATLAGVGEQASKGLHVRAAPLDYGSLGHYAYGASTGIIAAALGANSEIFQFRWTHSTNLAVIRRVRFNAIVSTTFFSAGVPVEIDLVKATAWTVAGTLGTAPTIGAMLKRRTSMSSTLVAAGDLRIATTTALGAGTKTLETEKLSVLLAPGPTAAPGLIFASGTVLLSAEVGDADHPLVLAQNEGFVIRSVAVPATGTWRAAIGVDWAEVTAY